MRRVLELVVVGLKLVLRSPSLVYALAFSATLSLYLAVFGRGVPLWSVVALSMLFVSSLHYADRGVIASLTRSLTLCGAPRALVRVPLFTYASAKTLISLLPPSVVGSWSCGALATLITLAPLALSLALEEGVVVRRRAWI